MTDNFLENTVEKIKAALNEKSIYELRQIGRSVGVHRPTDIKKDELIAYIIKIAKNEIKKVPPTTRGAPPKSKSYDQAVVNEINACRAYFSGEAEIEKPVFVIQSPTSGNYEGQDYSGVLVNTDGYLFVKTQSASGELNIFVPLEMAEKFRLREGDVISCKAGCKKQGKITVESLLSVNGVRPDMLVNRPHFDDFQAYYSDKRYTLDCGSNDNTLRLIDLFTPIGNGHRALISAPPQAGKTTLLIKIANALAKNYKNLKIFVLLIGDRPEDVDNFKRSVSGAEVVASTFDMPEKQHTYLAMLTVERAKRMVEDGKEVIILMDSITRLVRAYNGICGKSLSDALSPSALSDPKRLFGSARNTEAGSLTIIATADINTGSSIDDVIYQEFKSACNMEINLSARLAAQKLFPAINVKGSCARMEELLLSEKEIITANKLRSAIESSLSFEKVLEMFTNTQSNAELCEKINEWLK